jgi:hypothetical protein
LAALPRHPGKHKPLKSNSYQWIKCTNITEAVHNTEFHKYTLQGKRKKKPKQNKTYHCRSCRNSLPVALTSI